MDNQKIEFTKWMLDELMNYDGDGDIQDNEIEIYGEDEQGREGTFTQKITDIAKDSKSLINGLEQQLAAVTKEKDELRLKIMEALRLAYLHGIEDKEEGNDSWCAQGSKERIEDLVADGLIDDIDISLAAHDAKVREEYNSALLELHKKTRANPEMWDTGGICMLIDKIIRAISPREDNQ